MELNELEQRFTSVRTEVGSVAARIKELVLDTARELDRIVNDSPQLTTMLQHLEQVLHVAGSTPDLATPGGQPTGQSPDPSVSDAPTPSTSLPTSEAPSGSSSTSGSSSPATSKE